MSYRAVDPLRGGGWVYLLHFAAPIGAHDNPRGMARHYVGWSPDPQRRLWAHRAGRGAALTRAVVECGIQMTIAAMWPGYRSDEREAKRQKNAPRVCPVCRAEREARLAGRDSIARDTDDLPY